MRGLDEKFEKKVRIEVWTNVSDTTIQKSKAKN